MAVDINGVCPIFYILSPVSPCDIPSFIFLYKMGGDILCSGFCHFPKPPFSGIVLYLGPLTQVAEYLPFKQRVAGSNPARPTIGNAEASFHQ